MLIRSVECKTAEDIMAACPGISKNDAKKLEQHIAELEAEEGEREVGTYEAKGAEIGRLVDKKQKQYGDSMPKVVAMMRILYPEGIKPEQYPDALAQVRMLDKHSRIANGNQGEEDAWGDLAGYSILRMGRKEAEQKNCPYCDGEGWFMWNAYPGAELGKKTCDVCGGSGKVAVNR